MVSLFQIKAMAASCKVKDPTFVQKRQCYNPQMFKGLSSSKQKVMTKFAPIALYLQEITGYPASVIVTHLVKEKGWKSEASGNAFYGVRCHKGNRSETFSTPNGMTFKIDHTGCKTWQHYGSAQSSVLGYINLLLYADNGYYRKIRQQIPASFPPPASREKVINAIANSGYCAAGCSCSLGGGRTGTYGDCMRSIGSNSCAYHLDDMMLCDYDYPILSGLEPLHKNIKPSTKQGSGSASPAKGGKSSGSTSRSSSDSSSTNRDTTR